MARNLSSYSSTRQIEPNNINIFKTEIIAQLRQNKYNEARLLVDSYKERLSSAIKNNSNMPEKEWTRLYNFAISEISWANDMSLKLKSF